MGGIADFLSERDPGIWYPPEEFAHSLRPAQMFTQDAPNGLEVVLAEADGRPSDADMRRSWLARRAGRVSPVLLAVFFSTLDGGRVSLCGPTDPKPAYHAIEVSRVERLVRAALDQPSHHAATRFLQTALPELGTSVPGLRHVGLMAVGILTDEVPKMTEWPAAVGRAAPLLMTRDRTLVERLGYGIEDLGANTRMLTIEGRRRAVAVFCNEDELFDAPAVRFGGATPASFALTVADAQEVDWAILTRTSEIRLCAARSGVGVDREQRGEAFVELNLALLSPEQAGYLDLLFSADALTDHGTLEKILDRSNRFAAVRTQEGPMTENQGQIGCIEGEIIMLERRSDGIALAVGEVEVRLSTAGAARLVDWLTSYLDQPDDSPVIPSDDPPPEKEPGHRKKPERYHYKVPDLIAAGLLDVGTVLILTHLGREHRAAVTADGQIEVAGQSFRAPSGACQHVTGWQTCPGWNVWKDPEGRTLAELRNQLIEMRSDG